MGYCKISAGPLRECTRFMLFLGCNFMFFGTKEEIVLALTRSGFRSKNSKVPVTFWSVNFVEKEWFRRLLNIC